MSLFHNPNKAEFTKLGFFYIGIILGVFLTTIGILIVNGLFFERLGIISLLFLWVSLLIGLYKSMKGTSEIIKGGK